MARCPQRTGRLGEAKAITTKPPKTPVGAHLGKKAVGFKIKHCIFEIEYLEGDIKDTDKAMIEELLCKVEPSSSLSLESCHR